MSALLTYPLVQYNVKLSREHELLLACLPLASDGEHIERILQQRGALINWDSFINIANWHGVTPLVYRTLSQTATGFVPKGALTQLMGFYISNAARNQIHTQALLDLIDLLQCHHISVVCFKGPILSQAVYGDLNVRCFADLDLLVHREDTPRTRQLLMEQNYVPKRLYDDSCVAHYLEDYLRSQCWDDTFTRTDGAITIDLHETLTPPYFPVQFDLAAIHQRLQSISVQNKVVSSFSDEDLLLYLCVHGCKELWRRLIWICDIAELVRSRPHLNWEWILAQAQQCGIERIVLLSLALTQTLQGVVLPPLIQQRLHIHPQLNPLIHEFQARLLSDVDSLQKQSAGKFWVFHHPLHLKMRERWQDKLPQYWATFKFLILPNEADREFVTLPHFFSPLYFAIRPMRLLLKFNAR